MPNRIIKESICTSEDIDSLTAFEETCFYRLMVTVDDFGRFDARPKILAARLYPLKDITPDDMSKTLGSLINAGLVTVYEADGKPYLHLTSWEKHQQTRAVKSKYPAPPASKHDISDSTCNQLISDENKCPRNRIRNTISDNRNSLSLSDADANDIANDHNRVLDAAEDAGFLMSNTVRAKLINLYADYGIEKMLSAFDSCVKHSAVNLAYLEACLRGGAKKETGNRSSLPAQDYHQRDLSDAQDAAFERMMAMEE